MATIKDLQMKILTKLESKEKRGLSGPVLRKHFGKDGEVNVGQFSHALEMIGSPLTRPELEFLFQFWDTMAGQRQACGMVECSLIVDDLLASMPEYGNVFNSGAEQVKTNKGARGNLPSQAGGIFDGGSYAADARDELPPKNARAPLGANGGYGGPAMDMQCGRPKGNQSSIPGGIFGEAPTQPPCPSANNGARSNRSNASSIPGGIFGEAPAQQAPQRNGRNSNQSSIPGGIFG